MRLPWDRHRCTESHEDAVCMGSHRIWVGTSAHVTVHKPHAIHVSHSSYRLQDKRRGLPYSCAQLQSSIDTLCNININVHIVDHVAVYVRKGRLHVAHTNMNWFTWSDSFPSPFTLSTREKAPPLLTKANPRHSDAIFTLQVHLLTSPCHNNWVCRAFCEIQSYFHLVGEV